MSEEEFSSRNELSCKNPYVWATQKVRTILKFTVRYFYVLTTISTTSNHYSPHEGMIYYTRSSSTFGAMLST